jgi:hypothetical protein
MLVNFILPEVTNKWYVGHLVDPNFAIKIQQDPAGGHCSHHDEYLRKELEILGIANKIPFCIKLVNSPDLNICDLGPLCGHSSSLLRAFYRQSS